MPESQSVLAQQILKDPYNFDFLEMGTKSKERDIHQGLLSHLREFLIELGAGFAFVGSEVHLEVEDDTFRHPDDKPSIGLIICRGKKNLSLSTLSRI